LWIDPEVKGSDPITQQPIFNWGFEISVPGGGIAAKAIGEVHDAPTQGYNSNFVRQFTIEMKPAEYRRIFSEELFLKFDDGLFARVSVRLSAKPQRPFGTVESWFNPSGSRLTEFDPSKQIPISGK
jgi:hypothetical protein